MYPNIKHQVCESALSHTAQLFVCAYDLVFFNKGGGDGPEAVTQALYEAVKLKYRDNAIKICVIIADAPPHGLNQGGNDGFPNGNPLGHDPIKIAKQMAKLGIISYVVACEPSLSKYKGAHGMFRCKNVSTSVYHGFLLSYIQI